MLTWIMIALSTTASADVLINEVLYDPDGSDDGNEWVELCNNGNSTIDLTDWKIEIAGTGWSTAYTFAQGSSIEPGELLLVGAGEAFSPNLPNGGSETDGIRIVSAAEDVIDTLLFDNPNDNGLENDFGNSMGPFAVDVSSGHSLGRQQNCFDTNSMEDFIDWTVPTPGEPNQEVEEPPPEADPSCEELGVLQGSYMKINEFLPNPDGTDDGLEWVELYNSSNNDIDLSGWVLQWGTSSYSLEFVIPNGASLDGKSFLLIAGTSVENPDPSSIEMIVAEEQDLSMGGATSNSDSVRLMCRVNSDLLGVADTVVYGPWGENTDEWLDDSGNIATSMAPKPSSGLSLSRRSDGLDSDNSQQDFTISTTNTPGKANPEIVCEAGNNDIKINEIFPNPDGTDGGNEWVELYNAGSDAVRLDTWVLQTAAGEWKDKFIFPPETSLAAGEYLLIGESAVPADIADNFLGSTSNLSLGNASTGVDGVRLLDCPGAAEPEGVVQDTVLYGKADAEPSPDEESFVDDAGNISFSLMPESGLSLGRFPDGADSNVMETDFQSNMTPTPGSSNSESSASNNPGSGDLGGEGCGSSKGDEEPGKCSSVGFFPNSVWIALIGVLWCRRRNSPVDSI